MTSFEYLTIPAPTRGEKSKEAKTPADRYALAFTAELNRMAAKGWEYLRADVLPSDERSGLTGRTTVYHSLLVFRREIMAERVAQPAPAAARVSPQPDAKPSPPAEPAKPTTAPQPTAPINSGKSGAGGGT